MRSLPKLPGYPIFWLAMKKISSYAWALKVPKPEEKIWRQRFMDLKV